jgi:hypothetical protein
VKDLKQFITYSLELRQSFIQDCEINVFVYKKDSLTFKNRFDVLNAKYTYYVEILSDRPFQDSHSWHGTHMFEGLSKYTSNIICLPWMMCQTKNKTHEDPSIIEEIPFEEVRRYYDDIVRIWSLFVNAHKCGSDRNHRYSKYLFLSVMKIVTQFLYFHNQAIPILLLHENTKESATPLTIVNQFWDLSKELKIDDKLYWEALIDSTKLEIWIESLHSWFQAIYEVFLLQKNKQYLSSEPYPTTSYHLKTFLSIMTFNFAKMTKNKDIKHLTSFFEPHDIVFLQEFTGSLNNISNTPLSTKYTEFNTLVTNLGFTIQQSAGAVGIGKHNINLVLEYPTVLYKSTKVALLAYGSISAFLRQKADPKETFRYCPYIFKFIAVHATEYFPFICVSVHLPAGNGNKEIMERKTELTEIANSDVIKNEKNVLILGDFNFKQNDEIDANLSVFNQIRTKRNLENKDDKSLPLFRSLNDGSIRTNFLETETYDHTFCTIPHCDSFKTEKFDTLKSGENVKSKYSDHLPCHFKISLP